MRLIVNFTIWAFFLCGCKHENGERLDIHDEGFKQICSYNNTLKGNFLICNVTRAQELEKINEELDVLMYSHYLNDNGQKGISENDYCSLEIEKLYNSQNRINTLLGDEILKTIDKNIEQSKFLSYRDVYYNTYRFRSKADILYNQNSTSHSIATLLYVLYKLSINDLYVPKLIDETLLNIINILSGEQDVEKYKTAIESLLDQITVEGKLQFSYFLSKSYTYPNRPDSTLHYLKLAETVMVEKMDTLRCYFNLGYAYEATDIELSLKYYYAALNLAASSSCLPYRFYLMFFLYDVETDEEKKSELWKALNNTAHCSQYVQDNVAFRKYQFIDPSHDLTKKELLDELLKERELGFKLYKGASTLHLQDYYSKNSSLYFDTYLDVDVSQDSRYGQSLVQLFYSTRRMEKFRIMNQSDNGNSISDNGVESSYSKVNGYLKELSNFEIPRPFTDPIYRDLYLAYEELEKPKPIDVKELELDVDVLQERLHDDQSIIVNFSLYGDYYRYYLLAADGLETERIKASYLDSVSTLALSAISDQRPLDLEHINEALFSKTSIGVYKNVILILDGMAGYLPWELVFKEQKISTYPNIKAYMDSKPICLSSKAVNICSYTDESTLSSTEKRPFPELAIGYQECKDIREVIGDDTEQYTGADFVKPNLRDIMDTDVLHISSHSYGSTSNRLDNYMLMRDENLSAVKVYCYELINQNYSPPVVCLSSCNSGIGEYDYGTDVYSLSKIFLENGSQSVIKTLWEVNEKATSILYVNLYTYWMSGLSLGESLAKAKEDLKANPEYTKPYYWAGFVLEGNPDVYIR